VLDKVGLFGYVHAMSNKIEVTGEHGEAIKAGKALLLGALVYYPDQNELTTIIIEDIPKEEILAILRQFPPYTEAYTK
jgi:hypothetical protein